MSSALAYKRHFPAIDWLVSYSLYGDRLAEWFSRNVDAQFNAYRTEISKLLQEEARLDEIVRLGGMDALSPRATRMKLVKLCDVLFLDVFSSAYLFATRHGKYAVHVHLYVARQTV